MNAVHDFSTHPHDFASELAEAPDDNTARIVETWEAWREAPWSFDRWVAFELVMSEHVTDLRLELASAGWEAARV